MAGAGQSVRKLTMDDIRAAAERLKNWGRWGANDEIGTLNYTRLHRDRLSRGCRAGPGRHDPARPARRGRGARPSLVTWDKAASWSATTAHAPGAGRAELSRGRHRRCAARGRDLLERLCPAS